MRLAPLLVVSMLAGISSIAHAQTAKSVAAPRMVFLGTQSIECSGFSERCIIPVYVTPVGATDCVVRMDFAEIHVNASQIGVPIRVVWLLVKGLRSDNSVYEFDSRKGIALNSNDSNHDFKGEGHDVDEESGRANPRRFRWISVHSNPAPQLQSYDFFVVRKTAAGPQKCSFKDPKIINQ